MTDGYLMDADCVHGIPWFNCGQCAQPPTNHCPECGGYGLRGCGNVWHDGKPDNHCSPACECRDLMRDDIRVLVARIQELEGPDR